MDCFGGCCRAPGALASQCGIQDVSDPYVVAYAIGPSKTSKHRLLKTSTINNNLNPIWDEDFFIPIANHIEKIELHVIDRDPVMIKNDIIGKTYIPVIDLIRYNTDNNQQQQRVGIHKIIHLDDKPHHGSLQYYIEYIPKDLLYNISQPSSPTKTVGLLQQQQQQQVPISSTSNDNNNNSTSSNVNSNNNNNINNNMVVPNAYFHMKQGNKVKLYINADDIRAKPGNEKIEICYNNNNKIWKPNRLFRDIYDSICMARHMIYIIGWSVDYRLSLLRGNECEQDSLNKNNNGEYYSPILGKLLKQKANEDNVTVCLLVWDDMTSNSIVYDGVIKTRDEQLRNYMRGSKVNLLLTPIYGGKNNNMVKQIRNTVFFTHHQKCIIIDNPNTKQLIGYVGGVDLTYGRYDDGTYPLFRSLQSDHKGDFHNACISNAAPYVGPREPWHDIHSQVQGPVVLDLIQNFEERWTRQGGSKSVLVDIDTAGLCASPINDDDNKNDNNSDDSWCTQLFRSIDERTANLQVQKSQFTTLDMLLGASIGNEDTTHEQPKVGKRKKLMQKLMKTGSEHEKRFISHNADSYQLYHPLHFKKDIYIDNSVHKGLIHHIRNAKHTIYIESQYFLSSSFLWHDKANIRCQNLVAAEITWKICEKIEAGERFTAYIVIPMWPEGVPESSSVQDILYYQYLTIQGMYRRVHDSIVRQRKKNAILDNDPLSNVTVQDYLNFYCLANRETADDGEDEIKVVKNIFNRTRRHLIYCHSKMTIVDDAVILVGSANINQRSLDGNRDSELLLGSWQPKYLASKESIANGDIHGFRLYCWSHIMGQMEDVFRNPSSLDCVRRVNEIAKDNWKRYMQPTVCEMTSYLIPYPIKVLENGKVVPGTENGKFPDTNANILGSKPVLPEYLTT